MKVRVRRGVQSCKQFTFSKCDCSFVLEKATQTSTLNIQIHTSNMHLFMGRWRDHYYSECRYFRIRCLVLSLVIKIFVGKLGKHSETWFLLKKKKPENEKKRRNYLGMVACTHSPSYSGDWGRTLPWAQDFKAVLSYNCTTAFQPRRQSKIMSQKIYTYIVDSLEMTIS